MTSKTAFHRTFDPSRNSWIASANQPHADFSLQNLPYGCFGTPDRPAARVGVAIGDQIIDLFAAGEAGLLPATAELACRQSTLNALMAAGSEVWHELRVRLSELLGADSASAAVQSQVKACLVPQSAATMHLPARIGDYTDFYASIHHATNVGSMLRPDQALFPNYKWIPVGYHGRSSSIVASGQPVRRPHGQRRPAEASAPTFEPTRHLDYELELGAFVGPGNVQGRSIPLAEAAKHIFGVVLLNDWSARDLQAWEYQPLGPFLAKNFATSISPWVVTMDALAPFRVPAAARAVGDPASLPHLSDPNDAASGGLDLKLEAWLVTSAMRECHQPPTRLSAGNFRETYWTLTQMLAHHSSNGCNLQPGDLFGSGTVSGPSPESRGCLLERTWRGTQPLKLPNGEERRFLEDGDEVILRGYAEAPGARRIGLGECRGLVLPA